MMILKVPKDAVACYIFQPDFMGGKVIKLLFDEPCTNNCAQSGDELRGATYGMVESMLGPGNIDTYTDEMRDLLSDAIDSLNNKLLGEESDSPIAQSVKDLQGTLRNFEWRKLRN